MEKPEGRDPPAAQRVLRQASGEWAIRTIGQSRKEPNCCNWDPDRLARDPKRLGGTPNCLPVLPDAHSPSVNVLPLVGWVLQGRLPTPLCVPQQAAPPGSPAIPNPGPHLTSRALAVAVHLFSPFNCLQRDSLLGPPPPSPEDPPRAEHRVPPHHCRGPSGSGHAGLHSTPLTC
uniref:Uncharacterized protein n=2 Tax=Ursus TaxID=9639 RepID=A0A452TJ23_URSMA